MKLMWKIIRESIKVLIIASILSSVGGFALKGVEEKLLLLLPFIIVLPSLNGLVGDFGIIITSKFSTFLYEKHMKGELKKSLFVKHMFKEIFPLSLLSALYLIFLVLIISSFKNFVLDLFFILKFVVVVLSSVIILFLIIFFVAIIGSYYIHKKNEDPDDVLIPITTSIADLGTMIVFSGLVYLLF
ncbi:MAG: magnesium transporter [Nanoarchaeota archaeon]